MRDDGTTDRILVVDLDGTLLRSDMLFESFWAACTRDWRTPFAALAALTGGRAALKRSLAMAGTPSVELLPYDADVVEYLSAWRARGGRLALVSAADAELARQVADHLGLFDEVHGSDGTTNLKGHAKARFLAAHYGEGEYYYVGDGASDLPAWRNAAGAVTVGAPRGLRTRVERLFPDALHLPGAGRGVGSAVQAMRPHHWLKNLLVFMPMLVGHVLTVQAALQSLIAFVAFGLVASSVYVLNDLLDLSADRKHPRKRRRPFAAGRLNITNGTWMIPALLVAGFAMSLLLGWAFAGVMLVYYAATTAYSQWIKRWIIADIGLLATLYTLRIVAGGVATGIPLSVWLLAFSIFFFFALAAVKRQAELVDASARGLLGASGRGYSVNDLPLVAQMATASGYVSVLVMALYLNSPAVRDQYSQPAVLWGVCLVLLYWISRTVMLAHRGEMHDDPVVFAARDPVSQFCLAVIVALAAGAALL